MRDTFIEILTEIAKDNKDIELITGDLGFGVLKPFWEQCPNQFTNAGIAEQNMTAVAAGLALENKIVFTYSIGNFPTLRCLEQIRNDCAYPNANVKIVCVGGGFAYGSLGMSHHATEDISIIRALPNISIICPGDTEEAREATRVIVETDGTFYLRLGRGGEKKVHNKLINFEIGKALKIKRDICSEKCEINIAVFSTGAILSEVTEACDELVRRKISVDQLSFHTVKPLDIESIENCCDSNDFIITVEENNVIGGFGSAVAEVLATKKCKARLIMLGINDKYTHIVGDQEYLRRLNGLDKQSLVEIIMNRIMDNNS